MGLCELEAESFRTNLIGNHLTALARKNAGPRGRSSGFSKAITYHIAFTWGKVESFVGLVAYE